MIIAEKLAQFSLKAIQLFAQRVCVSFLGSFTLLRI
jgi:hypothetical protein